MGNILKYLLLFGALCLHDQTYANYCPSFCNCDSYKGFNRATCSAQKLIDPNLEIPNNVEILDLSENAITTLDNDCFKGMGDLLNITLSYNNIHTVYLDAFSPLIRVQFIDLSNNRLEYIDDRIFENNKKLLSLNLSGNKFMSLQNKPLLKSLSIQFLSLHNSQMTHVYTTTFEELPSLMKINLSENLLITISIAPFIKLSKLKYIDLQNNRWICDKSTEIAVKALKKKNVDVRLNKCKFEPAKIKPMFERMMIMPTETTTTERIKTKIELVWKNPAIAEINQKEGCTKVKREQLCNLYLDCAPETESQLFMRRLNCENFLHNIKIRSATDDMIIGALVGIGFTLLMVLSIYFLRLLIPKKNKSQGNESARARRRCQATITTRLNGPAPPNMPVEFRRSLSAPQRRSEPNTAPEQSGFATFVSNLFERPRRHQYYRNLNQNTAEIIRRISRSSSRIGSRLSQHFTDARNPIPTDSEQLLSPSSTEISLEHNNLRDQPSAPPLNATCTFGDRSETPPPCYNDVFPKFM